MLEERMLENKKLTINVFAVTLLALVAVTFTSGTIRSKLGLATGLRNADLNSPQSVRVQSVPSVETAEATFTPYSVQRATTGTQSRNTTFGELELKLTNKSQKKITALSFLLDRTEKGSLSRTIVFDGAANDFTPGSTKTVTLDSMAFAESYNLQAVLFQDNTSEGNQREMRKLVYYQEGQSNAASKLRPILAEAVINSAGNHSTEDILRVVMRIRQMELGLTGTQSDVERYRETESGFRDYKEYVRRLVERVAANLNQSTPANRQLADILRQVDLKSSSQQ
jgi:hypothetical protein